jgi:3-hydroxyisobutyrate dehydrogenase
MFTPKCLYVGLGVMGYRIAGRLAGIFPTSVWNRTTAKATAHAEEFGTTALSGASPWDNDVSGVNVLLTCLPTSNEVMTFAETAPNREGNPMIWIDNTSGEPDASLEISKVLAPKNIKFLDAPVSGG